MVERRLVQAASLTAVVQSAPHLVFHLTTIGALGTLENVFSLLGLFYLFALPVALFSAANRLELRQWPVRSEGEERWTQ